LLSSSGADIRQSIHPTIRRQGSVLLAALLVLSSSYSLADQLPTLEIPSGPLAEALVEFGRQTGVSIVFGQEAVAGQDSDEVTGPYTPAIALNLLLTGTCLTSEWIRPTLVAIKQGCNQPPYSAPFIAAKKPDLTQAAPTPTMEEVFVVERRITGTRLLSEEPRTPIPVQIITRPEIELSGHQSLSHVLRYTTAVTGNSTSTLVTNGGDGSASVTLRGLPASNTLVLLNGRRMNPDAFAGHAVDLNSLPLAVIDRIEIVKDGASAVYGSDAVAGVVNVHTRRDQDSVFGDFYIGRADDGGLDTEHASLGFGQESERLQVFAAASWYDQGSLYSREREVSRSSDGRSRGGIDGRSSATIPAWVDYGDGPVILAHDGYDGSLVSQFRAVHAEDKFEYRDFSSLIVPSRRVSAFIDASWLWRDDVRVFVEGLATDYVATNQLAPTPLFTGFERIPISIAADQPFNPFDLPIDDLRRRLVELGPRKQRNESRSRRLVGGMSGEVGDFSWDVSGLYARTSATEDFKGVADASRIGMALSPTCLNPCVPINLFGPVGSLNEQMLGYIGTRTHSRGTSRLRSLNLNLDGSLFSLPAGRIEFAAGAEYRQEELSTQPDMLLRQGAVVGGTNFMATNGQRSVWEAYLEARLPILSGHALLGRMDANFAVRHSGYDDFGGETTPRLILRWEPVQGVGLRASWAEGFRAPDLNQLFSGTSTSFDQINDPCNNPVNAERLAGCFSQSDPSLNQVVVVNGGNPDLHPERTHSIGFGVDWQHQFEGIHFDAALDYFRLLQRDVVDTQAQYIVNENAATAAFPDRVTRDRAGNLTQVVATYLNIRQRDVQGLDISANVSWTLPEIGAFEFAVQATHLRDFKDRLAPGLESIDHAGTFTDSAAGGEGALPPWKASLAMRWYKAFWRGQYDVFIVSGLEELIPIKEQLRRMERWTIHNVQVSYLGPASAWFRVSLGINNLLNEPPPWSAAAFNDSHDSRTYDITGRFGYLRVERSL
jgi:iron complex outermembrane recepter protein